MWRILLLIVELLLLNLSVAYQLAVCSAKGRWMFLSRCGLLLPPPRAFKGVMTINILSQPFITACSGHLPFSCATASSSSYGGGEEGPHDKWTRGGQPAAGKHVFRGVRTTLSEIDAKGRLVRSPSRYRSWISPGSRFQPQANRYQLYVSLGCPWSCRVLSVLYMKGLDNVIGVSVVHPVWQRTRPNDELDNHVGWVFRSPKDPPVRSLVAGSMRLSPQHDCDGCIPDYVNFARSIREIYELARDKDGKYTVSE